MDLGTNLSDDQFDDAQISVLQFQLIVGDVPRCAIPCGSLPQQRTELLTEPHTYSKPPCQWLEIHIDIHRRFLGALCVIDLVIIVSFDRCVPSLMVDWVDDMPGTLS